VIDKIELRVENDERIGVPFTPEFGRVFADARNDIAKSRFHSGAYYQTVGDMRRYGYPVVAHLFSKRGKVTTHKLELIDCGKMSFAQIVSEIERVFSVDAAKPRNHAHRSRGRHSRRSRCLVQAKYRRRLEAFSVANR
jgi:hypothetical protein